MKIAIYARVSDAKLTDEGLRRQDINRQIEKATQWINLNSDWLSKGTTLEIVTYEDDNKSAFKDDYQSRPQFCALLREIRARRIQRVVIEDLTRWSRRIEDGLRTMKEVADLYCTITSLAEGEVEVTTPQGWFRCAIGFLMAEWASRSMAWKIKSGMARAKSEGTRSGKVIGRPKKKGEVENNLPI